MVSKCALAGVELEHGRMRATGGSSLCGIPSSSVDGRPPQPVDRWMSIKKWSSLVGERGKKKKMKLRRAKRAKLTFHLSPSVPQLVGYIILLPTVSCSKYPHNYNVHKQKLVFIVSSSKYHII